MVKTLKEFQYIDEDGKDQGANVRQKAKDITNLLQDESRLREERRARAHMRDRMIRGASDDPGASDNIMDENQHRRLDASSNPSKNGLAGKRPNRDEEELRKAIEESKKSLAQERVTAEQRDLERAIRMSQEEEDQRKKQVADSDSSLFDDTNPSYVSSIFVTSVKSSSYHPSKPIVTRQQQQQQQQQPLPFTRSHTLCNWSPATIHFHATGATTVHFF